MSTYPESCVHVLVVTGECPSDILMPNPVHVPSYSPIPVIPTSISVPLRNLNPTPDFSSLTPALSGENEWLRGDLLRVGYDRGGRLWGMGAEPYHLC